MCLMEDILLIVLHFGCSRDISCVKNQKRKELRESTPAVFWTVFFFFFGTKFVVDLSDSAVGIKTLNKYLKKLQIFN